MWGIAMAGFCLAVYASDFVYKWRDRFNHNLWGVSVSGQELAGAGSAANEATLSLLQICKFVNTNIFIRQKQTILPHYTSLFLCFSLTRITSYLEGPINLQGYPVSSSPKPELNLIWRQKKNSLITKTNKKQGKGYQCRTHGVFKE